jgi:type I restriction enzyme, S subunit
MPRDWKSFTVGEFEQKGEIELTTGPFGTQLKAAEYVAYGVPVINVRNIGFGNIRDEKLEFLSEVTVQRLSRHLLRSGDIVFGRKGAVERHVFIRSGHGGWFQGSDCLRLRVQTERIVPRFLSYCFLTPDHQQ